MDEDVPRRGAEEQDPEEGVGEAQEEEEEGEEEDANSKAFARLNDLSGDGGRSGPGDPGSKDEKDPGSGDSEGEALPYPALAPVVFFYLDQHSRPRSWCLRLVCNPYPFFPERAPGRGFWCMTHLTPQVSPGTGRVLPTHPTSGF
ncbi:hypothetical protein JRQ81_002128 [Phrynocephalus forsythii]|uniref:Voltage-dependent T-type calcium channel subunit alpha-1G n=1 Tax=Phrynocephalus forsythii TaxID=171643 RepID=A0A9Q0XI18_9SAUR|nr:hypothetical protein JRQ81_002128 [Phrynocephalus forsythii]